MWWAAVERAARPLDAAVSGAVLAFHLVKLTGLLSNLATFPTLQPGAAPVPRPRTSILVPARDEADRLPRALPGLLAQPAEEILVLDDESSDATAQVVAAAASRDRRLRLLTGVSRPPGWIGKNWACQQLADAATGDLLVFCDADVTLRPGALEAVWAQQVAQNADVFSVFPRQDTGSLGERLLIPLIDEVLLSFLPHWLLRAPIPAAATANGQLIAIHRRAYQALGGHRAVAGRIVEDVALARRARRLGLTLGLALGGELVRARMYEGYAAAVRGAGKSLRAVHGDSGVVLAASAVWHVTAYTWPWVRATRRVASRRAWGVAAVLGPIERLLVNVKTGRGGYAEALLVPVTALAALPVYLLAARRTARWKGREYR